MTELCFVDPICRLFVPTHCLVPYVGSGMPFEKYGTDASGVGCKGSNCRPTEGVIKPRLEVERGLESKYKNQYETWIGKISDRMRGERRQYKLQMGRGGWELLVQFIFYQNM
jgi:hypothetical protein